MQSVQHKDFFVSPSKALNEARWSLNPHSPHGPVFNDGAVTTARNQGATNRPIYGHFSVICCEDVSRRALQEEECCHDKEAGRDCCEVHGGSKQAKTNVDS